MSKYSLRTKFFGRWICWTMVSEKNLLSVESNDGRGDCDYHHYHIDNPERFWEELIKEVEESIKKLTASQGKWVQYGVGPAHGQQALIPWAKERGIEIMAIKSP